MSEPQDATRDVPGAGRSRRRWLLPAAGLAAALAVASAVVAATGPDPERPAARPVAAPTSLPPTAVTSTPSAVPVPVGPPSPTVTPARASTPTRRPAPARSTTSAAPRPRATTRAPKASCTPAGVVDVVQVFTDGVVKVAARTDGEWSDQLCPGERIRVFWATYRRTADGGATLYRSEVRYLDRASPTWTMHLVTPDTCGPWYVVSGGASIPRTLKPGVVPFGGSKMHWETGEHC